MPNANWQAEVNAALHEEAKQEKEANLIFNNPAVARYTLASGIVSALVGAAMYGVSTLDAVSLDSRTRLEAYAMIAGLLAMIEVILGAGSLLLMPKPKPRFQRKDGPPAIGW